MKGTKDEDAVSETAEVAATYADLRKPLLTYADLASANPTYADLRSWERAWANAAAHAVQPSASEVERFIEYLPLARAALETPWARRAGFTISEAAAIHALVLQRTPQELRSLPQPMRARIATLMPELADVVRPDGPDREDDPG